MGPDDFIAMYYGWLADYKLKKEENDRTIFVLRHLTMVVHNTLQRSKIRDPASIIRLSMDPDKNDPVRRAQLKQRSDELFRRARERGKLK